MIPTREKLYEAYVKKCKALKIEPSSINKVLGEENIAVVNEDLDMYNKEPVKYLRRDRA